MPTKPRQYPKHIPKLQSQIIKEIALSGHLSNTKLKERLEVTHSVISEAIKVLMDRKMWRFLILILKNIKVVDLKNIIH